MVSRLPESDAEPMEEVISGSNLRRAYSRSDASQRGVSLAICGLSTSAKYVCSALAICNSAQAEKTAILTMTWAFELSPFKSPIAAVSDSPKRLARYEDHALLRLTGKVFKC